MAPLFDLDPLVAPGSPVGTNPPRRGIAKAGATGATVAVPTPVDYWVRGVFRLGDGERTRTVQAVGMSTRLNADVERFVRYLTEEGFQFVDGRARLVELLAVTADDGVQITRSTVED